MEFFVFGNIQGWGDGRLKISIFGAIWCRWGHMVPRGAVGAVGAVGSNGSLCITCSEHVIFIPPEMDPNMSFTQFTVITYI